MFNFHSINSIYWSVCVCKGMKEISFYWNFQPKWFSHKNKQNKTKQKKPQQHLQERLFVLKQIYRLHICLKSDSDMHGTWSDIRKVFAHWFKQSICLYKDNIRPY